MISVSIAESLFALILLVASYFISHTLNGALQAYILDKLGDPTAKNEGYLSLNPVHHFDFFGFFALILVGVGWLQTVPIDPYSFVGRFRYARLLIAFALESAIGILIASIALFLSVYSFGYILTHLLLYKLFMYYSKISLIFFSNQASLNIAAVFSEAHSPVAVVCAFMLVSLVYLNTVIATISIIYNTFRYVLVVGFEQGYSYIEYADYLAILGPILVVIVFGENLLRQLLFLTDWQAGQIAYLFGTIY